jgi:hypothetical protein
MLSTIKVIMIVCVWSLKDKMGQDI